MSHFPLHFSKTAHHFRLYNTIWTHAVTEQMISHSSLRWILESACRKITFSVTSNKHRWFTHTSTSLQFFNQNNFSVLRPQINLIYFTGLHIFRPQKLAHAGLTIDSSQMTFLPSSKSWDTKTRTNIFKIR